MSAFFNRVIFFLLICVILSVPPAQAQDYMNQKQAEQAMRVLPEYIHRGERQCAQLKDIYREALDSWNDAMYLLTITPESESATREQLSKLVNGYAVRVRTAEIMADEVGFQKYSHERGLESIVRTFGESHGVTLRVSQGQGKPLPLISDDPLDLGIESSLPYGHTILTPYFRYCEPERFVDVDYQRNG